MESRGADFAGYSKEPIENRKVAPSFRSGLPNLLIHRDLPFVAWKIGIAQHPIQTDMFTFHTSSQKSTLSSIDRLGLPLVGISDQQLGQESRAQSVCLSS
jgi:hypothetical protein